MPTEGEISELRATYITERDMLRRAEGKALDAYNSAERSADRLRADHQLRDVREQLSNLEHEYEVRTKPTDQLLKDNGLELAVDPPHMVAARLRDEMEKAAEAGDIHSYKSLRAQRNKLFKKTGGAPMDLMGRQ